MPQACEAMLTKEMLDARQAVEREEKELAELVKMYDAAESYEEF